MNGTSKCKPMPFYIEWCGDWSSSRWRLRRENFQPRHRPLFSEAGSELGLEAKLPAGLAPAHGLTLVEVAYPHAEVNWSIRKETENQKVYKSYYPKASEIDRKWVLVDANGQILGRIATRIAHVLLGKHKPTFTPGVEMGDYVVVVNAERVTVTGTKTSTKLETKMYHRHSNYPGGS